MAERVQVSLACTECDARNYRTTRRPDQQGQLELKKRPSVSETLDGDAPHHASGCPFQAWSVAELLRQVRAA